MSWWGKIIGGAFGYMLGGPLGALLGAAIGHNLDRGMERQGEAGAFGGAPGERERVQTAFFTATFSVMGHLAKADGRVTEDEIETARRIMGQMDLDPGQRRAAIGLFRQGKQPGFPLDQVLDQFRAECGRRANLMRLFLEIQLTAAYADGVLHPAERALLEHICRRLRFPPREFQRLEALVRAARTGDTTGTDTGRPSLAEAYAILGVSPDAPLSEVRRAYRRLLSQHHPDKLVSKGLPEEMMRLAAQKTHQIRQAWETIRSARE
ncbi:MAG: co-chaperone DjlA [Gammaproteobacteria bacterium]|nr:MAG: co-chaperone DjlA [Gammaproteobacteria bacterium]